MRVILFILIMLSFTTVSAQTLLPTHYHSGIDSNIAVRKWSLQKYGGISASYGFFDAGNASIIAAPVGLQLNRRINNNLFAFAGIAAAPAYINFNRSFIQADIDKNNQGIHRYNSSGFSMNSKFEAGLMYINDAKTFSISGSIGVYRSTNPQFANPTFNGSNLLMQQPVIGARQ
ncbi:MAG: hypothetical protein ACRC2O_18510 [Chitinophagaceae bacterium]